MKLRLKEIRESQFLSQRELAAKACVGISTIVRLEKGHQEPTFKTIKRLAAALCVEPSELVVQSQRNALKTQTNLKRRTSEYEDDV